MAYGSGFGNNLPPWKPMSAQTPPPSANPTTAPGPITDYNAGQLRMLQGSNSGQMPAGGAARPPVSQQVPINNSVGQMTPRSAGIGGATSPNADSLTKFDNFLRPKAAFMPQATVNTPGLVEGMANTPRSMGQLFSGSTPPSAYSTYLASGGVLPPESPKPVADLSAMRGDPRSTVGYSMGGSQPPRSPGAPFSLSTFGGDIGGSLEEARNLSRAAGVIGSLVRGTPGVALAGISGPAIYREAMDPRSEFGATLRGAGDAISREQSFGGKVGATAAAAPFVIGTGVKAGLRPLYNFLNEAVGGASSAYAAPTATPRASSPPPASPPVVQPPAAIPSAVMPSAAQPSGPRTVQPAPQGQSLPQLYPDRFKGVPKFGDVVAGGAGNGRTPLTTQEKNYNAQILRGLELENRARELENVDRYRAVQLKDRSALAALQATREGGVGQQLAREQLDPEGRTDAMQQKLGQLDERASAVTNALFDPSTPSSEGRINRARQLQQRLNAAREAFGLPAQTLEEMVQSSYGRTYDPKSGYFKQPK